MVRPHLRQKSHHTNPESNSYIYYRDEVQSKKIHITALQAMRQKSFILSVACRTIAYNKHFFTYFSHTFYLEHPLDDPKNPLCEAREIVDALKRPPAPTDLSNNVRTPFHGRPCESHHEHNKSSVKE